MQAARWAKTSDGTGYIYSFNGPQSLFVDTIRSCRSLALAHQLGHVLMGERDERICLLKRLVEHANNTARYNIWYGEGRDAYDVAGRTAHESVFNTNNGEYRCPSTHQGYSPFSTWTRGLAWAMLGFAELLEWLATRSDDELATIGGREAVIANWLKAPAQPATSTLPKRRTCGVPYWDTGAPGLAKLATIAIGPPIRSTIIEPVDSSAAAIAAQGLLRLGHYLVHEQGETEAGVRYVEAGLAIVRTLLDEPYFSNESRTRGPVAPLGLSSPQRLGLRAAGPQSAVRRIEHVGRLPHARSRTVYVERLGRRMRHTTRSSDPAT